MSDITIALLGQPNSGKSTLFNALTGSHQHVGNWPGKTVEQKEGYFINDNKKYKIIDLPGTYSLSANSEEEIITREYIASGKADFIYILADASQLERSLFMLADYVGIDIPTILILNMMDVAKSQKKFIDSEAISKKLGIQVVPMSAADTKNYEMFFKGMDKSQKKPGLLNKEGLLSIYNENMGDVYKEIVDMLPKEGVGKYSSMWLTTKLLEKDEPAMEIVRSSVDTNVVNKIESILNKIQNGNLLTGDCKFKWIDSILKGNVKSEKKANNQISKFDNIATSRVWGKPLALGIIILGIIISLVISMPIMSGAQYIFKAITPIIEVGLVAIGIPQIIISLVCDGILTAVSFAFMMAGFVFGISLVFGLIEEVGYMARVSYVFDNTMAKLGLQGKAIMPFLVSFGCNIGGVAGTRVIDSWGQRVMTMALSWVVPCGATWGVVGLISSLFFGKNAIWVILSLFTVAFFHMYITSKVFGKFLITESEKSGLIMELPPYHKPKYKNLFKFVMNRMGDVIKRSVKVITFIAVIFWALSYTSDGNIENSIIYKIGIFIEPVTMWFGLRWQLFIAFLASAMGKESALGVLSSLFNSSTSMNGVWGAMFDGQAVNSAAGLSSGLLNNISKAEALAFIYAFFFNIPCIITIGTTFQESHSIKWTARIAGYYIALALIMSTIAYHVGLLIF